MPVNSIKRSAFDKVKKKKAQEFKEQLKKFKEQPSTSFKSEEEKKDNIVELYKNMSPTEKAAFNRELENKKLRDNYLLYLKKVHPKYVVTKFHALLAKICQSIVEKIEDGQKVRLCLSVPPQHGKSYTVTETLPSWFIGRNPDLRCIVTGYNADMAEKFGDRNRQLVKQFGKEIFGIQISDSQDNKTLWDIDKHDGGMYSAGILGGITGNPGSLIIVDDPFKNGLEAENQEIRDKVYDTFADSITTRAAGKGNAIIVIHTRWHDDDLIGRLEKLGDWAIINIPCVWEKGVDKLLKRRIGETLCPEIGKDADFVMMQEKTLGKRKFNALYQGKPYVEGGNIIKREDIRWYDNTNKPTNFDELVLSCDLTFGGTKKDNDPYCMTLWGRVGGNHYLLNIYDKKATFTETIKTLQVICYENPLLRKKLIEKKANGQATIDMLSKEIGGFVAYDPKNTSKEDRLRSVTAYFEGGNIYFPKEEIMPKIEEFVTQLLRFPSAEHDDFVDTISQYLLNYEYRNGGRVETDDFYSTFAQAIRGF